MKPAKATRYVVSKSNPILDAKNDMDLYEQRMFNLYISKINPFDEGTGEVEFKLSFFVEMLGITEVSIRKMHELAKAAVKIAIDMCQLEQDAAGGKKKTFEMDYVTLWRRFKITKNQDGEWVVRLWASEELLPYLFEIKDLGYVNFPVIVALRMRSVQAEKLYEQCSRFKRIGIFTITPEELRKRLGIADKESYKSYNRLKVNVIQRCLKEINGEDGEGNANTDILVEIVKEERLRTRGAPVKSITFSVRKNPNFKQEGPDKAIQKFVEAREPYDIAMEDIDITAGEKRQQDLPPSLEWKIINEYGLSKVDARAILKDQKRYGLSDDRVIEVIRYSIIENPEKPVIPIAYIRSLLKNPDAILDRSMSTRKKESKKKNQFNDFPQNTYDFDALERSLLEETEDRTSEDDAPIYD